MNMWIIIIKLCVASVRQLRIIVTSGRERGVTRGGRQVGEGGGKRKRRSKVKREAEGRK